MKQKLYDLKIKVLKSKINSSEKLEIVEQIFQIETDLTINYTHSCTELKVDENEDQDWDAFVTESVNEK